MPTKLNMSKFIGLFFMLLLVFSEAKSVHHDRVHRFNEWLVEHDIKPVNDVHLEQILRNWIHNDKYITMRNEQNLSYKLGHNMYSGMSNAEFSDLMRFDFNRDKFKDIKLDEFQYTFNSNLPESIDWRQKDAVTPIKNQGQCGSCYSFSTTGALEGAFAIKYGVLYSFSEQQIVDCSDNDGCNGGMYTTAWDWINKNGGICNETSYPYTSGTTEKSGKCHKCNIVNGTAPIQYKEVSAKSDTAMMNALTIGPVSVAIEADQQDFQLYSSGIFTAKCGTNLDHAVLLVGYGTDEKNQNYYILKNSWGESWGEEGYMYLARGNYNNGEGQCGVLMAGAYPILA